MTRSGAREDLVGKIEALLADPAFFKDVLDLCMDAPYRDVLIAWSALREKHELMRDEFGRYWIPH
jgi:hypothetical protein